MRRSPLESRFNPRPCARGDSKLLLYGRLFPFQSTPLREGRLPWLQEYLATLVSIHAPARGATVDAIEVGALEVVSIHAPARGATSKEIIGLPYSLVSIHAPARGATEEVDAIVDLEMFQSTPLREGRHWSCDCARNQRAVSIHAPARGATYSRSASLVFVRVSIHAPARGATISLIAPAMYQQVSIHAPARGATIYLFPKVSY